MSGLEVDGLEAEAGAFRLGPVDLGAEAGTATVVLGPSGAGKTTLLRAIAGLTPCRAGALRLDGSSLDGLPPERRGVGFVPPDLGLFADRTVRRNVGYPLELRGDADSDRRTEDWLARFGLQDLAGRYPEQLSSGERQRVAMARALAAEPRLLLWDEPLSALDVESRDALLRLLRELLERERIPLVLVTHEPSVAFALASRLVVLLGGKVRYDGGPEMLARAPLDRFVARFLGYENLFTPEELRGLADPALTERLLGAAGPEGLVVPGSSVGWNAAGTGHGLAVVSAVRWTAAGWVVAVRCGSITLHAAPSREPVGLQVGARVDLVVDAARCLPIGGTRREGGT